MQLSHFIDEIKQQTYNLEGRYVGDLNLLTLATFSMSLSECSMTTREITKDEKIKFDAFYSKFINTDIPTAYIVGFELFLGNKIYVTNDTLIPRFETEELVLSLIDKITNKYPKNSKLKILDVCTGTGVIGISLYLKLCSQYEVDLTLVDISCEALEVCKLNLKHYNIDATVLHSDMTKNVADEYDIVVSNPPYIDISEDVQIEVTKYEPHLALYAKDNGLYLYKLLLDDLKRITKNEFLLMFEIGMHQAKPLYDYTVNLYNLEFETIKDMNGLDRNLFLEGKWNIR